MSILYGHSIVYFYRILIKHFFVNVLRGMQSEVVFSRLILPIQLLICRYEYDYHIDIFISRVLKITLLTKLIDSIQIFLLFSPTLKPSLFINEIIEFQVFCGNAIPWRIILLIVNPKIKIK